MVFYDSIIPCVGKTDKLLGSAINKTFKDNNICLSRAQFIVLKTLNENNGKPQQDLVFITESDKTSLSRLITNMEKHKFIKRKASKEDKRIKKVFITQNGKDILEKTIPILKQTIKRFQKNINEAELTQAKSILEKIQNNIYKEYSIKL